MSLEMGEPGLRALPTLSFSLCQLSIFMNTTESTQVDIRPAATELIKTIMLLNRPYGFSYLLSIVRGQEDYLKQPDHRELESFGALQDEHFGYVQDVAWHLFQTGYLELANPQYGTIQLTLKGSDFLNHSEPLVVDLKVLRMQWYHLLLIGELRDLRREEAKAKNAEPYEIFTNFVMMQIARKLPADEIQLRKISSLEKAEEELVRKILDKIAAISSEMDRDEELYGAIGKAHSYGHRKLKELFEAGTEIMEIARIQNLKENTMYWMLENLHLAGHLDLTNWIEEQLDSKVLHRGVDYFKQAKNSRLTDAHDVLGMDYPTLRMCRVYARPAEEPIAPYKKVG